MAGNNTVSRSRTQRACQSASSLPLLPMRMISVAMSFTFRQTEEFAEHFDTQERVGTVVAVLRALLQRGQRLMEDLVDDPPCHQFQQLAVLRP